MLLFLSACARPQPSSPPVEPADVLTTADPCAAVTIRLQCDVLGQELRQTSVDRTTGVRTCEAFCIDEEVRRGPYRAVVLDDPPRVTRGTFQFGRRDGQWTTRLHDDRGPLVESVHYVRGPRHGTYATYYDDGSAHISGAYDRERKHGKWLERSPGGVVVSEQNYVRGTIVGTQIRRHENGQNASIRTFDESGRPHGAWCSWRPDGEELGCTELVDGTGTGREYGPDGTVVREVQYKDGKLDGVETVFDHDRTVEIPWVEGVQTGVQRTLVGECVAEEKWLSAGEANGPYIKRDCETQELLEVGSFCGGHFCGLWVHRQPTGEVRRVVEYDELSMKLAEAEFDNDGKLVDFWTMQEQLRLQRAACYQALAGGLCCDIEQQYRVSADCLPDSAPAQTTEL